MNGPANIHTGRNTINFGEFKVWDAPQVGRYRELFERSADAVLIIVGDKFVDCNAATVKTLRYNKILEPIQLLEKRDVMKKCPFCAEGIQDEAFKCKHCGEFIDPGVEALLAQKKIPWYFRTSFIVLAFCAIGPLALPLIWWHPTFSVKRKTGLTIIILILSWFMLQATIQSIDVLKQYYNLLNDLQP